MRLIQGLAIGLIVAVLGGCAHPIHVELDLGRMSAPTGQPQPITVGDSLPNHLVNLAVTTPGA